jgi:polyisoprenoid-binding protein YceI
LLFNFSLEAIHMAVATIEQATATGSYVVDPVHSFIGFAVKHNGVSTFRSGFGRYEARLTGGEEPRLAGVVEVASIQVEEPQLRGHLLSPEFFDADRHPQLRFESTEVRIGEDGTASVRGGLEIRGEKHSVEATGHLASLGEDAHGKARVGLSLATTVDRRDFGLAWNAELPSGGLVLEFEVEIAVELELIEEGR